MYVDQHYIHEVTSLKLFKDYEMQAGIETTRFWHLGPFDHNVPRSTSMIFEMSFPRLQIDKFAENVEEFGIEHAAHGSEDVHMVGWDSGTDAN